MEDNYNNNYYYDDDDLAEFDMMRKDEETHLLYQDDRYFY